MAIKTFVLENNPDKEARHAAVQTAVAEYLAPDTAVVEYDSKGKPSISGTKAPKFISITTTGAVMLCVISDLPVGIDGEYLGRLSSDSKTDYNALAERFFSEEEADYVRDGEENDGERFLRIWVRKEAYVKVTGKGVSEFQSFSVSDGERFASRVNGVPIKKFNISFPDSTNYVFAIAGME